MSQIAKLNDQLRGRAGLPNFGRPEVPGTMFLTRGVASLPTAVRMEIWATVRKFKRICGTHRRPQFCHRLFQRTLGLQTLTDHQPNHHPTVIDAIIFALPSLLESVPEETQGQTTARTKLAGPPLRSVQSSTAFLREEEPSTDYTDSSRFFL
jgi:hypothetical protein